MKTPRARSKIRQWFSRGVAETPGAGPRLGDAPDAQTEPFRSSAWRRPRSLATVAEELKYQNLEALYVAVGEGHVSPQSIVARVSRLVVGDTDEEHVAEVPLARPVRIARDDDISKGVVVRGLPDVWVRLSRCCTPCRATRSSGS